MTLLTWCNDMSGLGHNLHFDYDQQKEIPIAII